MRAARGFSLIEVLVAMGVLVVGIVGVLALFAAAADAHRRALEETTAAIIADSVIAEQRAAFNRNRYGDPLLCEDMPVPGYELYTCSVRPTVLARDRELGRTTQLNMEVDVHFAHRGRRRTITYRTIFFRE